MDTVYMHQKCKTILSKIDQIVGNQFSDREEEIIYVPVYVDVTDGTIRVAAEVAGGIKHEYRYLKHFLSTPTSEQHQETTWSSLQRSDSNNKDLSCSETLPTLPKTTQDEDSVLNTSLEQQHKLYRRDRTRSSSSDECIAVTNENLRKEEHEACNDDTVFKTSNMIHATNISCDDKYNKLDSGSETASIDACVTKLCFPWSVKGHKKAGTLRCQRYRLKKKLQLLQISDNLQELMEINTVLKSKLLILTGNIKLMNLVILLTVKSKNEASLYFNMAIKQLQNRSQTSDISCVMDHDQEYSTTSYFNKSVSELQQIDTGNIGMKEKFLFNLEEISESNKNFRINLSELIATVQQMKLILLKLGKFKSEDIERLQNHLVSCHCMAKESYDDIDQIVAASKSCCGNSSSIQVDSLSLTEPCMTSANTLSIVKPRKSSRRTRVKCVYKDNRQLNVGEKLNIKRIIEDCEKLLKQSKQIRSDLYVLNESVKRLILMLSISKTKISVS